MPTIIEYTDKKQPENQFPERIVSPVRSGPCCFSDMEGLGEPQAEGRVDLRLQTLPEVRVHGSLHPEPTS